MATKLSDAEYQLACSYEDTCFPTLETGSFVAITLSTQAPLPAETSCCHSAALWYHMLGYTHAVIHHELLRCCKCQKTTSA